MGGGRGATSNELASLFAYLLLVATTTVCGLCGTFDAKPTGLVAGIDISHAAPN